MNQQLYASNNSSPEPTNKVKIWQHNNHVYLYDEIDKDTQYLFQQAVADAVNYVDDLNHQAQMDCGIPVFIHINSYGGDAHCGLAMYDFLQQYRRVIVTVVEGVAASAASLVYLGAACRKMTKNSSILIHEPYRYINDKVDATSSDTILRNLEGLRKHYAKIYAHETLLTEAEALSMMRDSVYLYEEDLIAKGFAGSIVGEKYDEKKDKTPYRKLVEEEQRRDAKRDKRGSKSDEGTKEQ